MTHYIHYPQFTMQNVLGFIKVWWSMVECSVKSRKDISIKVR